MTDFASLPDLACRTLGGAVIATNDEAFCPADNLISAHQPGFSPKTFDQNGQIYDGWETRRRREQGHDWAVIRLGAPGVIRGVNVNTAFFIGNYPEKCTVEAAWIDGYPSPEELSNADWHEIVAPTSLKGDADNIIAVSDPYRYTHVRLNIFPDGGVARIRVHGEVIADPALLSLLAADLAAVSNGGRALDCSDAFFAEPNNMLMPGLARTTGDGWESRRRRDDGNDWALVALAAPGNIRLIELDTSRFKFNAPGWAAITGVRTDGSDVTLLERCRLQPDTLHRFQVESDDIAQVRLDIYPDGGVARFRVFGTLSDAGAAALAVAWAATSRQSPAGRA